jgi:hypothetical protein
VGEGESEPIQGGAQNNTVSDDKDVVPQSLVTRLGLSLGSRCR